MNWLGIIMNWLGIIKKPSKQRLKRWLETRFAAKSASAEWNTPKKFRLDTPTADLARKSGEKRKADFEHEAALVTKHHMRALCF